MRDAEAEAQGMRPRILGIISGCVIVIAAMTAALAIGPSNLISFSKPRTNPDSGGTGPSPMAFDRPTWHTGDSWTYSANTMGDGAGRAIATGTLTRTVESMDASVVNVSVVGSFRAQWTLAPDDPQAAGSIMLNYAMGFRDATVGGYTWYRASDLATLKEVRTIMFKGTFETEAGTFNATYVASIETTFDPALDVWSFPLEADQSWTTTSTATVHGSASWSIDTPTQPWSFSRDVSFTRNISLSLMSGPAQDVVTPAGTFPSIPIWIATPHIGALLAGHEPGLADGLDEDVPIPRDHASAAWFSGTAKNVVKVDFDTGDAHLELTLTDYHLG